MPKADDGVAGARIASTPAAKASSKSFLISVRTLRAHVAENAFVSGRYGVVKIAVR